MGPERMPAAEVDVSPGLVRKLLAAQQPDLAHLSIEVLANGWDNVMYLVGEGLVARLPRREEAVRLVVNEQRWLPVLQPRLPLDVLRCGCTATFIPPTSSSTAAASAA